MRTTPTILFTLAASSAAQMTTSVWMYTWDLGTDKIGWVASIVDAKNGYTTMAIQPQNGTDTKTLNLLQAASTITVAPTHFEVAATRFTGAMPTRVPDANIQKLVCRKNATEDVGAVCSNSYGPNAGILVQCATQSDGPTKTSLLKETITHSYPAIGSSSAGVETISRTLSLLQITHSTPTWCANTRTSYPPEASARYSTSISAESSPNRTYIRTYQVVITAGVEKLGDAASTGSVSKSASSSSSGSSSSSADAGPSSTSASASSTPNNANAVVPSVRQGGVFMAGLAFLASLL